MANLDEDAAQVVTRPGFDAALHRHEYRHEHRYEQRYSWRDQKYLAQYKAKAPRRAFIRWVPDLTWWYCSVRSGNSSFHRAKPPPKSDNAALALALCLVDQGLAVGESLSGRWGKGGLAAVKGPAQGIQHYAKPLSGMYDVVVAAAGMLARLSSRLLLSHTTHRARKGLKLGQI
ncbi:hypothetical protein V8C42DRAFT_342696 [Trichoderma barbatum]